MNAKSISAAIALLALGGALGWGASHWHANADTTKPAATERKVLYWYDPMVPGQKFDKPGKSPFMDMQLVPKFAPGAASDCTIRDVKTDGGEAQP